MQSWRLQWLKSLASQGLVSGGSCLSTNAFCPQRREGQLPGGAPRSALPLQEQRDHWRHYSDRQRWCVCVSREVLQSRPVRRRSIVVLSAGIFVKNIVQYILRENQGIFKMFNLFTKDGNGAGGQVQLKLVRSVFSCFRRLGVPR